MKNLLSSKSGTVSSTRASMLLVVCAVLFQMVYVTVKTGAIAELPIEQVYLVASVFGLKGWQKINESKSTTQQS